MIRLMVDDERTFTHIGDHDIARSSAAGVAWLEAHRDEVIDEIWLDHDLGGDDTIMPIVDYLAEADFEGQPLDVRKIYVHSMNPIGAANVVRALARYGYNVHRVPLPD